MVETFQSISHHFSVLLQFATTNATRSFEERFFNPGHREEGISLMELVRFFAMVIKIAIFLALIGELKSCTLELLNLSAVKSKTGIMSYSKFTRELTK